MGNLTQDSLVRRLRVCNKGVFAGVAMATGGLIGAIVAFVAAHWTTGQVKLTLAESTPKGMVYFPGWARWELILLGASATTVLSGLAVLRVCGRRMRWITGELRKRR